MVPSNRVPTSEAPRHLRIYTGRLQIARPEDPDGDALKVTIRALPRGLVRNGTAVLKTGDRLRPEDLAALVFVPEPGFTGPAGSLQYLVEDGRGGRAESAVEVEVMSPAEAAAQMAEAALWERLRANGRAEDIEAYIRLYPDSRYKEAAVRRLDELLGRRAEAPAAAPPQPPVPAPEKLASLEALPAPSRLPVPSPPMPEAAPAMPMLRTDKQLSAPAIMASPLSGLPNAPTVLPLPPSTEVQSAVRLPAVNPQAHPIAPPSFDFRIAATAAVSAVKCGIVTATSDDKGITLVGVAQKSDAIAAQNALTSLGIPSAAARVQIEIFDAPYCGVLAQLRDLAAVRAGLQVSLESSNPLLRGQVLRFKVQLPDWPAYLNIIYLMVTGDAGHLVSTTWRLTGNSSVLLTDPKWEATEPYGTELLITIASERPLFGGQRWRRQKVDYLAPALASALRTAKQDGARLAVQVVAIQTMPQ
jgi:hypothetical protein